MLFGLSVWNFLCRVTSSSLQYYFHISDNSCVVEKRWNWGKSCYSGLFVYMSDMLTWYKCFLKHWGNNNKKRLFWNTLTTPVKNRCCTLTWIISSVEKAFGGDRMFQKSLSGPARIIYLRKTSFILAPWT